MARRTLITIALVAATLAACGDESFEKPPCDEICEMRQEVAELNRDQVGIGSIPHLCTGARPACYWRIDPTGEEYSIECKAVGSNTDTRELEVKHCE